MKNPHSTNIDKIFEYFQTTKNGLSEEEAKKRINKYGLNEISKTKKREWLAILASQFTGFLQILLFLAACFSIILGDYLEASAIIAIIILSGLLGFFQEYKAEKSMEKLERLFAPIAKVLREGKQKQIPAKEIVPGDIILLEAGDIVPADCRIFQETSLQIDESSLTGESVPSKKIIETLPENCPIADQENMAFSGTTVTYGKGMAITTATGNKTEFGKIAETITKQESKKTALEEKFEKMSKQIGAVVIAIITIVFLIGITQGKLKPDEMLVFAISLAVAAVPNSLPAVVTISLALGANELAKNKMIVRKLDAIQNLGQTTIICSDKTGTITKNEMTATKAFVESQEIEITGSGYEPKGEIITKDKKSPAIQMLAKISTFCNNSKIFKENGKWKIIGDPTEAALLVFAKKTGYEDENKNIKVIGELPFDAERKLMTTIISDKGKKQALTKGAPDILLKKCTTILEKNGKKRKITEEDRKKILETNSKFAQNALRVLGFAYKENVKQKYTIEETEKDLIFVGLIGMIDPPREEVKEAIENAKNAGIKIMMITGDHPETAKAIAEKIGIYKKGDIILTGEELEKIDEEKLQKIIGKVTIISRALPIQKLKIINALKKKGEVVIMTGDGVNDAPALKKADVGISMGITGTDIAKEVSSTTITDDNFATIITGIKEGRSIYYKIMNSTKYLLSCNLGEITIVILALIKNTALPLSPLQILVMNLLTDGLPAIGLGFKKSDSEVMKNPPIKKEEHPLQGKMLIAIIIFGITMGIGSFLLFSNHLWEGEQKAKTIAFTTLVMFQMFAAIGSRSIRPFKSFSKILENKWLIIGISSSIILQLAIIYLTPLQQIFETTPLSLNDWTEIITISIIGFIIMEATKIFLQKNN